MTAVSAQPAGWAKVTALYDELGLIATIDRLSRSAARRARRTVYVRDDDVIISKALAAVGLPTADAPETVPLEPCNWPELQTFDSRTRDERSCRRVRSYAEAGYHAFLARVDGALVGYYWWVESTRAREHPHVVDRDIRLSSGDVYGFEYFVAPPFRGGRRASEILISVEQQLHEQGFRRIVGYVTASNRAARWLYATHGYSFERRVRRHQLTPWLRATDRGADAEGRRWLLELPGHRRYALG